MLILYKDEIHTSCAIISAIAIPALLAQRENARNKSSMSNCTNILANFVTAVEKLREDGNSTQWASGSTFQSAVIGTDEKKTPVPMFFTARNPWGTTDALEGYNQSIEDEADTSGSEALKAADPDSNMGQVQITYLKPDVDEGTSMLVATAVALSKPMIKGKSETQKQVKVVGVD